MIRSNQLQSVMHWGIPDKLYIRQKVQNARAGIKQQEGSVFERLYRLENGEQYVLVPLQSRTVRIIMYLITLSSKYLNTSSTDSSSTGHEKQLSFFMY